MSWETLEPLVRDAGGADAEALLPRLHQILRAESKEGRAKLLAELAAYLHAQGSAGDWVGRFARASNATAQRLALELAARLPVPLDKSILVAVGPLLNEKRYPTALRLATSAQLLRSFSPKGPAPAKIGRSLVAGLSRPRALARLEQLARQVPGIVGLDALRNHLETRLAMRCPRCGVRLPRPDMAKHLWQDHKLLLDGRHVREPWQLVEEWVGDYARSGDAETLERACELGRQLDPDQGPIRVQRLLLAGGSADPEALDALRAESARRRVSVCPSCFSLTAAAGPPPPRPLTVSHGRVAGPGYTIELLDDRLVSHLVISTPKGKLYDGSEPGRPWSRRGAICALVGPVVLIAWLMAMFLPRGPIPPIIPVVPVLLAAILLYLRVRMTRDAAPPTDRAVDHAWQQLVPRLHRDGIATSDAEFLASLGLSSLTRGRPLMRSAVLAAATHAARDARTVTSDQLAALWRLEASDAKRAGGDPAILLSERIGSVLAGTVPLAVVTPALADVPNWPRGERARLRALVCGRAFEAGWEVWDLHDLGNVVPELGGVIGSDNLDGLARLRWLWSLRPKRPWQKTGAATTVFDLARYPALSGPPLEARPDLLLFQPLTDIAPDATAPSPILICDEGVFYRDKLLTEPLSDREVTPRAVWQGGGFELRLGSFRWTFRHDPKAVGRKLAGWTAYLFRDFLPGVDAAMKGRREGALEKLLAGQTTACGVCGRTFFPRIGEIGRPIGDA
jgi:hypothetical protein